MPACYVPRALIKLFFLTINNVMPACYVPRALIKLFF